MQGSPWDIEKIHHEKRDLEKICNQSGWNVNNL